MTTTTGTDTPASAARVPETGTLLGIWAHPDDEAFLSSALMATARRRDDRVVVATATLGEQGVQDPVRWPPDRLAAIREQELRDSLALVGVVEHRLLGHRDGTLEEVPRQVGVAQVAALIDEVRPDTIVTFGPEGMTGHSDHRTVSAWVGAAWTATGRRSALWHATLTPAFHRTWGALNDTVGLWFEGARPPTTPTEDLVAQVVCDRDLVDLKYRALRAHASQIDSLVGALGEGRFRRWWAVESFA
ncbi:MAG TPA: PIG-L family deacetylase [Nocardioidaceae bacterium]